MKVDDQVAAADSVWAIVLTHGGAEEVTAACLDSLLRQDYPALTVLLVDNASFDGSGERLRDRYPSIRYLNTGGNIGYTGGNNRGIEHALASGADYVFILNNDTVVEPACVSLLVNSARQVPAAGAIAPKILYHSDPGRIWFAGGDYSWVRALGNHRREMEPDDPGEPPRLDEITFVTGCAFLMPAGVARAVGGFREDYFIYCEDVELSLRLARRGYRMYYQPAARLLHREEPRKSLSSPFATVQRDRNRRRLVREHYNVLQRIIFAMWFYPTRAARLVQYLLRGDGTGARAVLKGAVAR
jgi:GT2 family glycosyltransferase